ncbi:5081eeb2-846d-41ec-9076-ed6c27daf453-CDS [Sclerotinia trifoliorum]|uniref:5081eeb2-846d-41ec-9076-ed6c27daf453-CDS n=1 Tax=Sclerotinia trifoliorum TaxID=28548 RepID=A0A8H2VX98_9HELO|nr:5081eeb2-846d-41ec-9076-ed6c27daf453-CDS [Sclerotinia trifoliorum]
MKKFFIATCLFASIAYVAIHMVSGIQRPDNPFSINLKSPLSSSQWALDLECTFDQIGDELDCRWLRWAKEEPIPNYPVRKEFRFELRHKNDNEKIKIWEPEYSNRFVIFEDDRRMLPVFLSSISSGYLPLAEVSSREISPGIISFPMKVSCVRNHGFSTVLWCERRVYDIESRAHWVSLVKKLGTVEDELERLFLFFNSI